MKTSMESDPQVPEKVDDLTLLLMYAMVNVNHVSVYYGVPYGNSPPS